MYCVAMYAGESFLRSDSSSALLANEFASWLTSSLGWHGDAPGTVGERVRGVKAQLGGQGDFVHNHYSDPQSSLFALKG